MKFFPPLVIVVLIIVSIVLGYGIYKQKASNRPLQKTTPTPTPTSIPVTYLPAPAIAIKDTKNLLNNVLNNSLIPNTLEFTKQNVDNSNNYKFYGAGWQSEGGETFVASVEYDQKDVIIDKQITVHLKLIPNTLTSLSAIGLAKKYFTFTPATPFKCIDLPTQNPSKFCEAFWTDNGVKKGIDITSPAYGLNETQFLYCEHHKGTPAYSWLSCNYNYSKTGIE